MTASPIVSAAAREILPEIIALRHQIHERPEIGLREFDTARLAAETLRRYGCDEVTEGVGGTGVVALIRGRPGSRCVAFRADMDALPLEESTGCPWSSKQPGMMHACGHDGHVAWALATAWALARDRSFPGTAMIIIQPGEEGWAGARKMIEDGLFTRWSVDEVYGGHCAPDIALGHFGLTAGVATAAADLYHITVRGVGGHGARPHRAQDPIVAAAQLVLSLQTIVSRSVDPMFPAVVTVGSINAGSDKGVSVIPESVRISGTTRCSRGEDRDLIERRMNEICEGVGRTTCTSIELRYSRRYPPLRNAEPQRQAVGAILSELAGPERVHMDLPGSMGAEDFSFMCEAKPGVYIRVGVSDETHRTGVHNPGFDFNDAALEPAAIAFATIIQRRLTALEGSRE